MSYLFGQPKFVLVLSADKPIHIDITSTFDKVLEIHSFNISDDSSGRSMSSNNFPCIPFS